jgi:hypothetical protein
MHHAPLASRPRRRRLAQGVAVVLAAACLFAGVPGAAAADRPPPPAADPAVVATWHEIAVRTITAPAPAGAGKANVEAFLYYAFVQTAVHNAVNGITREYELYGTHARGPMRASPQAAAAAAAHRILDTYFGTNPTIAADLDARLATSLAEIPDGVSERLGVRFGEQAADRIVRLRADDGRNAPVVFDEPPAPGVWRPTPPANVPFFAAWLGQVEPLVLDALDQFRPGPPPAISSDLYVQEFEEVRDYGVNTGSSRSPEQTETALFFADTGIVPFQTALRELVTRRGLDISDSARLLATVSVSVADSIGAVWDAKYVYGWWRPITAIREADTDGNPATAGVPDWTPVIATPPYPDWPSGLGAVAGAMAATLPELNGDGTLDLNITSAAAGVTRHYDDPEAFVQDVVDARVWLGIHFRTADEVGAEMGLEVGAWTLDHAFAPTRHGPPG